MSPFVSKNTVTMNIFTDCCAWNLFLNGESIFPIHRLSVQLKLEVANQYLTYLKICFD